MTTTYRLGWHPDAHDPRDLPYEIPESLTQSLPVSVDLTPHCPAVYDQLQLGSCTANALAAAFEFDVLKQDLADFVPSRLFIYYYERVLEGDVSQDNGASLRDGMKVLNRRGVCPESLWPYDISKFAEEPSVQCNVDALKDRAIKYRRIPQDLTAMKTCLASGTPFVFGIAVYPSFMAATDGMIPMPAPGEQSIGGHALLCVGFSDAEQRFYFRNSWGTQWPAQPTVKPGYGTIPYAYLLSSNASDFWEVSVVGSVVKQLIDGAEHFLGMPGD